MPKKDDRYTIRVTQTTAKIMEDFDSLIDFKITREDLIRISVKRLIQAFQNEGLNALKEPELENVSS